MGPARAAACCERGSGIGSGSHCKEGGEWEILHTPWAMPHPLAYVPVDAVIAEVGGCG